MTRGEARLAEKFASARSRGRAAFVAYLTAGDPSFDRTLDLARRLDRAGADILGRSISIVQRTTARIELAL